MLFCPKCRKLFMEDGDVCPYDGTGLTAPPDDRMGQQVGSYMILDILGKGGMGKVYKAEHIYIGKTFAIKVLHPRFIEHHDIVDRFIFEARAAAKINHPNIIEITDFGYTPSGLPFFVMEHMTGNELTALIDDESPLPVYRSVNIMVQVADALAACHEENIVHQDLKPENIFLVKRKGRRKLVRLQHNSKHPFTTEFEDTYDMVKVLDFGVAHLAKLTSADTVAGTPEYMAPEQAQGTTGDPRSDIYSLGVILYEMLCGFLPFTGETSDEIFRNALTKPVPRIKERYPKLSIPIEMQNLLEKAMAKKPKDRHQNMDEFIHDLKGCFGNVFYSRDIPTVLKKKTGEFAIDAVLQSDLKGLFSKEKSKPTLNIKKKSKGGYINSEKLKAVTGVKKISSDGTIEFERRNSSEHELEKPGKIDEHLAEDLKSLFSKKKKK